MKHLFAAVLALALSACGPTYVTNTRIPYTAEKQALADVVESYRVALEQRDIDKLKSLVSEDYYENASTTDDPTDDYGYEGFLKICEDLRDHVSAVRVEFTITSIDVVSEEIALVDLNYKSHYLFDGAGEEKVWQTANDKNRLTFKREKDHWRILSGL